MEWLRFLSSSNVAGIAKIVNVCYQCDWLSLVTSRKSSVRCSVKRLLVSLSKGPKNISLIYLRRLSAPSVIVRLVSIWTGPKSLRTHSDLLVLHWPWYLAPWVVSWLRSALENFNGLFLRLLRSPPSQSLGDWCSHISTRPPH